MEISRTIRKKGSFSSFLRASPDRFSASGSWRYRRSRYLRMGLSYTTLTRTGIRNARGRKMLLTVFETIQLSAYSGPFRPLIPD
jgi:hypothetical protein